MMTRMVQLSFVIPAFNEEEYVARTIRSVMDAVRCVPVDYEVIVVDNNSTDRTAAVARSLGARVVAESISGIARARNRGARAARGEWLVFVDADTLISDELLARTVANLSGGRVVAGGAFVRMSDSRDPRVGKLLSVWNWLARTFRLVAGSYIYVSRRVFVAVRGFNPNVYAGEEILFAYDVRNWCRRNGGEFSVIEVPVDSSARKLEWFPFWAMLLQTLILCIFPFAAFWRPCCFTWYRRRLFTRGKPGGRRS